MTKMFGISCHTNYKFVKKLVKSDDLSQVDSNNEINVLSFFLFEKANQFFEFIILLVTCVPYEDNLNKFLK